MFFNILKLFLSFLLNLSHFSIILRIIILKSLPIFININFLYLIVFILIKILILIFLLKRRSYWYW